MRGWFKGIILGVAVFGVGSGAVTLATHRFPAPITDDVVFTILKPTVDENRQVTVCVFVGGRVVSKGVLARLNKGGGGAVAGQRCISDIDPFKGPRGEYAALVGVDRVDCDLFRRCWVEYYYAVGRLGGHGFRARLVRKDGGWMIEDEQPTWIS